MYPKLNCLKYNYLHKMNFGSNNQQKLICYKNQPTNQPANQPLLPNSEPILGEQKQSFRKSLKEEVVLFRLHIGHTRITHSYLMTTSNQYAMHAKLYTQ